MIFANRESNSDIDIDRITCENHCDTDEYRTVLQPSSNPIARTNLGGKKSKNTNDQKLIAAKQDQYTPTTMIKLRTHDKFVVVREAPWRVYDQIEIFIHPTQISLTHNFYKQWKVFFFENNPFTNIK